MSTFRPDATTSFDAALGRGFLVLAAFLLPPIEAAQAPTIAEPEPRVAELEAEYAVRGPAFERTMEERLAELEAEISALKAQEGRSAPGEPPRSSTQAASRHDPTLDVSGDFRPRYEHTAAHAGAPARDRGVLPNDPTCWTWSSAWITQRTTESTR